MGHDALFLIRLNIWLISRISSLSILALVLIVNIAPGATAGNFENVISKNQIDVSLKNAEFRVTFLGSSSFLIDDGQTQILIDGFITRQRHRYFKKIKPSEEQILAKIEKIGICKSFHRRGERNNPKKCRSSAHGDLKLILPVHGHYDHALDAPYIAAWTGAPLFIDKAIAKIQHASEKYRGFQSEDLKWKSNPPPYAPTDIKSVITKGEFTITLIKTPHDRNVTSLLVSGKSKPFEFPARLWKMKEGTSFSVLIKRGSRSLLIVPTAGKIGSIFKDQKIEADVVMLGIGGLGLKSRRRLKTYWTNTVQAVGASRVIPIHWDNDQVALKDANSNFTPNHLYFSIKTWNVFSRLAQEPKVTLRFAPAERAFDPFIGMK